MQLLILPSYDHHKSRAVADELGRAIKQGNESDVKRILGGDIELDLQLPYFEGGDTLLHLACRRWLVNTPAPTGIVMKILLAEPLAAFALNSKKETPSDLVGENLRSSETFRVLLQVCSRRFSCWSR